MRIRTMRHAALLSGLLLLALAAGVRPAQADVIVLGSDYLQTQPGTYFDFGGAGGFNTVYFTGNPIGPGFTDTIVQRQADATINGPSIPIRITALSLESSSASGTPQAYTASNGYNYDLSVTLAANPTGSQDTGNMTIMSTNGLGGAGGTFNSSLDVFFDVAFVPTNGGPAMADVTNDLTLTGTGNTWSPYYPPESVIVNGVDGGANDQNANYHTNIHNGPNTYDVSNTQWDFFPTATEAHPGGGGLHIVDPATVPEPSSLLLVGGMLGLGAFYRGRRSRRPFHVEVNPRS